MAHHADNPVCQAAAADTQAVVYIRPLRRPLWAAAPLHRLRLAARIPEDRAKVAAADGSSNRCAILLT